MVRIVCTLLSTHMESLFSECHLFLCMNEASLLTMVLLSLYNDLMVPQLLLDTSQAGLQIYNYLHGQSHIVTNSTNHL